MVNNMVLRYRPENISNDGEDADDADEDEDEGVEDTRN